MQPSDGGEDLSEWDDSFLKGVLKGWLTYNAHTVGSYPCLGKNPFRKGGMEIGASL